MGETIENGTRLTDGIQTLSIEARDAEPLVDARKKRKKLDSMRSTWRRFAIEYGIKIGGED